MSKPCGGCGAETSKDRCIGCFHDFEEVAKHPFQDIEEVRENLKKFFNEAPLEQVLNFVKAFENLGAGLLVRQVLIVWIDGQKGERP